MTFSEEQIQQIRSWMPAIYSIGDLQTKLNTTFQTHLTYLETRFLMDDLDLQIASKNKVEAGGQEAEKSHVSEVKENLKNAANVDVSVDPVTRPGMVCNGSVTFSDGQVAEWSLDQMGRLGLKPKQSGYRPSAEDIASFQECLQQKLAELSNRNSFGL